jgi:hypothetical protein
VSLFVAIEAKTVFLVGATCIRGLFFVLLSLLIEDRKSGLQDGETSCP